MSRTTKVVSKVACGDVWNSSLGLPTLRFKCPGDVSPPQPRSVSPLRSPTSGGRPRYSVFGDAVLDCYSLSTAALETLPPQKLSPGS